MIGNYEVRVALKSKEISRGLGGKGLKFTVILIVDWVDAVC